MNFQQGDKYPEVLNPYTVLNLNPNYCNLQIAKKAFNIKMQGNENPSIRLAYDMLVNPSDYNQIDYYTYSIKQKNIFYYAHVNGLEEIKYIIGQNKNYLYQKDNLGRTIFYLAARNGYYSLCEYLLEQGANINDSQLHGSTPLQSAIFYGHYSIAELIKKYSLNNSSNNNFNNNQQQITKKYTIHDFDAILQKSPNSPSEKFLIFFNEKHANNTFNHISIFDKEKYHFFKKDFYLKYYNKLTKLEKSCVGAMLGMAIGDAMGARVEFKNLDYNYNKVKDMGNDVGGKFKLKPGQWTDDTALGLCLADSLIENDGKFDGYDIMKRFISWWFYGYNNPFRFDDNKANKQSIGLGGNVKGSFMDFFSNQGYNEFTTFGDTSTSGNGSIVRNAPIPICFYKNMEKALDMAKKQSKVTHQGNQAAGCCQLLTYIIVKILNGEDLKNILNNLKYEFKCEYKSVNYLAYSQKDENGNNWNWNSKKYEYNQLRALSNPGYIGSYSMDAMAMTLHILINTNSFQEAILKGVNLCGDADSLGAVIGQIAGAFYGLDGIPKDWIEKIYQWDKYKEIALRGYILCHLLDNI